MNKIYRGIAPHTVLVNSNLLNPYNDLANCSTNFSWGHPGSGSTRLALAILADYYNDKFARKYYKSFKFKKITKLPRNKNWSMTSKEIEDFFAAST